MVILVTGGAGFIGSAVVRQLIRETDATVVNVDKLTYAGNLDSLAEAARRPPPPLRAGRHLRRRGASAASSSEHRPDAVMHLAAESHVDRSIDGPGEFIRTNVVGTFTLLAGRPRLLGRAGRRGRATASASSTSRPTRSTARSAPTGYFTERRPTRPNSPYSASKAASDHLVRAWHHTYGLPTLITNCSNNYGPYQFPEKLIPLVILNALAGKPLPDLRQGRERPRLAYVEDHARALRLVLETGEPGETYNIGGHNERTQPRGRPRRSARSLDELRPDAGARRHASLITFVTDRPGPRPPLRHRRRARSSASWAGSPRETFETGLRQDGRLVPGQRATGARDVQSGGYRRRAARARDATEARST